MRGLRALLLGIRFGLALNLCGAVACGVLDVKRPGPPPPCPSDTPSLPPPPSPAHAPPPAAAPSTLPPLAPPAPAPMPPAPTPSPTPSPAPTPMLTPPVTPVPAPRTSIDCPADMVALPAFCIDRYEAPNVPGALPFALRTAADGEQWCGVQSKRLCSEDEWVRACQGPHGRRFPYGDAHRASACNDDRPWIPVSWKSLALWPDDAAVAEAGRLFQADVSGARADCVSEEGVYDLTGNVAEWVRRDGPAPRPGYEHVLKGCYWAGCYHEPEPNCLFRNSAHPGTFRTYEAGFRCCRALRDSKLTSSRSQ
jgi:formylglycine-generating enzyme